MRPCAQLGAVQARVRMAATRMLAVLGEGEAAQAKLLNESLLTRLCVPARSWARCRRACAWRPRACCRCWARARLRKPNC